jgi:hypothetical protein
LIYSKPDSTMTATLGYLWRLRGRNIQLQLVVNNLLNDHAIFWTTSTNGTATTAFRPRDGNYNSPRPRDSARRLWPEGTDQLQPVGLLADVMTRERRIETLNARWPGAAGSRTGR